MRLRIVCIAFASVLFCAVSANAQVGFGVKAIISSDLPTGSDQSYYYMGTHGYSLGLTIQKDLDKHWYFSTGPLYTQYSTLQKVRLGCEITSQSIEEPKSSIAFSYYQIRAPFSFYYKILNKRFTLAIGAGISMDCQLGGHGILTEVCPDSISTSESRLKGPLLGGSMLLDLVLGYRVSKAVEIKLHPYNFRDNIGLNGMTVVASRGAGVSFVYYPAMKPKVARFNTLKSGKLNAH